MPRHAAAIAIDRIRPDLVAYLTLRMIREEICEQVDIDDWSEDDVIIHGLEECAIRARNDLRKIDFSLENMTPDPATPYGTFTSEQARQWLGPQAFGDLVVIGCMGGGDREEPVAFVVYFDGKDFRGYVPTNGNGFDIASKAAIGTDPAGAVAREFDVSAMRADVIERILVRS